jgi:hypothetical protein
MIFIYSITEKQLTQKSIHGTLKSNPTPQNILLMVLSGKDRILITYPADAETGSYTVGSILNIESK